jgi:uncharacterized protein (TIGR02594 family)
MIPAQYRDLLRPDLPRMLKAAVADFGVKETPGPGSTTAIMQWAHALGIRGYRSDDIPWCGLAVAHWAQEAGRPITEQPLWALSWRHWGEPVTDSPALGDVLVWSRRGGGHVGMYVGHDETHFHCLGGNQGDAVNIRRFPRTASSDLSFVAVRRPPYKQRPVTAMPVVRSRNGAPAGGPVT